MTFCTGQFLLFLYQSAIFFICFLKGLFTSSKSLPQGSQMFSQYCLLALPLALANGLFLICSEVVLTLYADQYLEHGIQFFLVWDTSAF